VGFLGALREYKKDEMQEKQISKIRKLLKHEDVKEVFEGENMKKVSKAGYGLLQWVVAMVKYFDVAEGVASQHVPDPPELSRGISTEVGVRGDVELIRGIFAQVDKNGDGHISKDEFADLLTVLNPTLWSKGHIDELFEAADANGDGSVHVTELVNWIVGDNKDPDTDSESGDSSSSSSCSSLDEEEVQQFSTSCSSLKLKEASLNLEARVKDAADKVEAADKAEDAEEKVDATASEKLQRKPAKKKSDHLVAGVRRSVKHEEPHTTLDEMYELLTMRDGSIGTKLIMEDLADLYAEARRDGLGLKLERVVLQKIEGEVEAEDVSVLEVAHLCALLLKEPDATLEDARSVINGVKFECRKVDTTRRTDLRREIEAMGMDLEATIGFKTFKSLIELLGGLMQVDQENLLSTFVWVRTSRFEMSEAMAIGIMQQAFLKVAAHGNHILDMPISENDFCRMAHSMNIIDKTEKKGIAHGKLAILYGNVVRHLPRLRLEREKKRYADRGSLAKRPRRRKHPHRRVVGRSQLAILFEELYKRIPSNRVTYRSPLWLVLSFLETGEHVRKRFH